MVMGISGYYSGLNALSLNQLLLNNAGLTSSVNPSTFLASLVNDQLQSTLGSQSLGVQTNISALGQVQSSLASLQDALNNINNHIKSNLKQTNLSSTTNLTATAGNNAVSGLYNITVNNLAAAQTTTTSSAYNVTDTFGVGSITIQVGNSGSQTVNIDNTNNTLSGLVNAINTSGAGVTASIKTDNTGQRLSITANQSGAANTVTITTTSLGSGSAGSPSTFAFNPSTPTGNPTMTLDQAANNSSIKVGNTIYINSSNTVTGAVAGVTLNLLNNAPGAPTILNVSQSTTQLSSDISNFVTQFNAAQSTLTQLGGFDINASLLVGQSEFNALQNQLNSFITTTGLGGNNSIQGLSSIGINLGPSGQLNLNQATLSNAIATYPSQVAALFDNPSSGSTNGTAPSATQGNLSINLNNFLNGYTDAANGVLQADINGLNQNLKNISNRQNGFSIQNSIFSTQPDHSFSNLYGVNADYLQRALQINTIINSLNGLGQSSIF